MFTFFDIIIKFLETVVSFIVHFFEMIGYLFGFIVGGVTFVFQALAYMPSFLWPFVTVVIGYSILIVILNRGK